MHRLAHSLALHRRRARARRLRNHRPLRHASTTTTLDATRRRHDQPARRPAAEPGRATSSPAAHPRSQAPSAACRAHPQDAIAQFALAVRQLELAHARAPSSAQLAALSVGSARLAEQQAAATSGRDSEIARAPRLQPRADHRDRSQPHQRDRSG